MNASQSSARALAPPASLCPPWCEHEHLGLPEDPCGFHHDGAVTAVGLERPPAPGGADLFFVNVSQVERHGELGPAYVEVQDERRTIALLTPAECVQLAHALLDGARQLRHGR